MKRILAESASQQTSTTTRLSKSLQDLIDSSLITGSVAFGVTTRESDIDIVLRYDDLYEFIDEYAVEDLIVSSREYEGDEFTCCRVRGTKYNLIIAHTDEEYARWVTATKSVKAFCATSLRYRGLIANKTVRVDLFKSIYHSLEGIY